MDRASGMIGTNRAVGEGPRKAVSAVGHAAGRGRTGPPGWRTLLSAAAFGLLALLVGYRIRTTLAIPGVANEGRSGLVDFRDQAYYPVRSLLAGDNPYDAGRYLREYPAVKVFAPYSPVLFVLFLPFGLLPLEWAQPLYYLVTLGLMLALGQLALRLGGWQATAAQVFAVATLALASRPGEWNAVLGQFGVLGCIAAYAALSYGDTRPWVAGIGLAVSLFKPTYGVPVAVLMLAQRDRRAVTIGVGIAGLLSLAVAGVLVHAAGGIRPFALALSDGYAAWRAESGDPLHTAYRVDAAALLARALGHSPGIVAEISASVGLMGVGVFAVRHAAARGGRGLSASVGALVVLTCVYHLLYDLLLLVLPIVWMARHATRVVETRHAAVALAILALLALPMLNYAASERAAALLGSTSAWWHAATALNAAAPLLALLVWVAVAFPNRETSG